MPQQVCFISFHELALKRRNRSVFERRLRDNLNGVLDAWNKDCGATTGAPLRFEPVRRIAGRLTLALPPEAHAEECAQVLARVPGVASVALAYKIGRDFDQICEVSLQALQEAVVARGIEDRYTFKVKARRSSTDFEMPSMEIARQVGAYVLAATGAGVRMKDSDITVSVTVVEGSTYISTRRFRGIGGLPSGSSGKVVSLLSSGIDSPVATWRLLKRGSVVLGLHFSGRPATSDASERLVKEIGDVLARTGGLSRIYVIPFGDIQREIASVVEPSLRVIMYRRLMLVIAETLACSQNAKALVTGESLGQVASQTLDNIVATDGAVNMPVLRPLIGTDKEEIINEARHIDTFDLSIQDAEDCCTLFMPRSPETHARHAQVAASWGLLDIDELVARAIKSLEIHTYTDRFGKHRAVIQK